MVLSRTTSVGLFVMCSLILFALAVIMPSINSIADGSTFDNDIDKLAEGMNDLGGINVSYDGTNTSQSTNVFGAKGPQLRNKPGLRIEMLPNLKALVVASSR